MYLQPVQPSAGQLEEEKLRKKLDELMSDRALSSDEDEPKKIPQSKGTAVRRRPQGDQAPIAPQEPLSSSSDEMLTEEQKVSTFRSKSVGDVFQGKTKCLLITNLRHYSHHWNISGIQSLWKETINYAILLGIANKVCLHKLNLFPLVTFIFFISNTVCLI